MATSTSTRAFRMNLSYNQRRKHICRRILKTSTAQWLCVAAWLHAFHRDLVICLFGCCPSFGCTLHPTPTTPTTETATATTTTTITKTTTPISRTTTTTVGLQQGQQRARRHRSTTLPKQKHCATRILAGPKVQRLIISLHSQTFEEQQQQQQQQSRQRRRPRLLQ